MIYLFNHQAEAVKKLRSGSILCGGVGTGKSLTALAYFFFKECKAGAKDGEFLPMKQPKDLYIITTARKRDLGEWNLECSKFLLSSDPKNSFCNVKVTIDSWNNIKKYIGVQDAFFIFDEQKLVGSGAWVKSFYKIQAKNHWILLTATPADVWLDYVPVFIANGFYKNRTAFINRHVVYDWSAKYYPKVKGYLEEDRLEQLRDQIVVYMNYEKKTVPHFIYVDAAYDKRLYGDVFDRHWNPYEGKPIKNGGEWILIQRQVVNSDPSRLELIKELLKDHPKMIIFYNFNYELEALRKLNFINGLSVGEYNGFHHDPLPPGDKWVYLVQYNSGAEGWNCIETDTIVFYSLNYSYRVMTQAAGRIDRLNTPFKDLYYYMLVSKSHIDYRIRASLDRKENFNERLFLSDKY